MIELHMVLIGVSLGCAIVTAITGRLWLSLWCCLAIAINIVAAILHLPTV